jgi:hypothetical protein
LPAGVRGLSVDESFIAITGNPISILNFSRGLI